MGNELKVQNSLVVSGPASISGSLNVTGSIRSTAPASFSGSLSVTGSLGILNTDTSSSVLLDIVGSTNNSFTFRSNPVLNGGQNGLKVNVSTDGYSNNGGHIAYNFQVGGTSYFTIANYGLAKFNQSIETKGMLIQNNPSSTTSLIVYAQGGAGNAIETVGSEGTVHLGSNTLNTKVNEILRITGKGTTSSTTALLVQNSAATENFRIYDNGNITVGLGTTTFSSIGGNGNTGPSSSIYFDNYPNAHQVHHQIIIRAQGQGNSYNYLRFPTAYGGTYEFIGAGAGVTLGLSNSGSTAFMNYTHTGVTTNASNTPFTIDPAGRTLTFGGGSNDVNHLAPYLIILKGNQPVSSAGIEAGGDIYILGGLAKSGSAANSGSVYISGGTVNTQNTLYVTGSRVGIGTATPSASLHISGSSNSALFEIDSPAANNILYVSGSGRVGIGTSTPAYTLDTQGSGRFTSGVVVAAGQRVSLGGSDYGSDALYSVGGAPLDIKAYYYTRFTRENVNQGIQVIQVDGQALIKGSGTTSSTTALLVQNANASASLEVKDDRSVTVSGILTANSSSTIAGPLTVNFGGVNGGTSIYANGNTVHNQGRGIYATGYAYGIQANQTMVGNWSDQPNAAGVHGTGQIGVYGEGSIAGFSGPSAFFTALSGDARVNARIASSVVQIRGFGSGSATTALLVQNSNASASLAVLDNGNIGIGTSTPSASLHVVGNTILSGSAGSGSALLAYKSGSTVVDIQGSQGQLFSVIDALSGSLMSVNDISGLPILEVFSDDRVVMGTYGAPGLTVSGSTTIITGSLILSGSNITSAWTSYTPTWTTDATAPSLGNGTLTGAYKVVGKTCFVRVRLIWGTTTTSGTGVFYFDLPVSASTSWGIQMPVSMLDNGNAWYQATANGEYGGFTNKVALIGQSSGANSSQGVAHNFPFTFANLDSIQFNGSYEIA